MYSDEEDDFSSPDEGSDSEPMLGKCGKHETRRIQRGVENSSSICLFRSVVDPAFYPSADPDPGSPSNADPDPYPDPDPGQTLNSQKVEFLRGKYT
jgi:hypothetical protein